MKPAYAIVALALGAGLSGCIPTPVPRSYEFGALVPGVSGTLVDAESGAPIPDAKITVQYARCDDLRDSLKYQPKWDAEPDAKSGDARNVVMRNRNHPPSEWLAAEQSVSLSKSDTTDAAGKFEFSSRDRFTFFVIPLVPNAPVGKFYDRYQAAYRLVIDHPDYGVQSVPPSDKVELKKTGHK